MADDTISSGTDFGPRLAQRVRPRAHVARRITEGSRIGIVARSSAGFGLAIGMSQGSRPVVTPDTFTSTRLRPPVPVWRRHDEQPETPPPTASWTEQIVSAPRPRRISSTTPTAAQRSVATSAPAALPGDDDFVPSGDRKLDALRRMLATSPDGKPSPQRERPERHEGSVERGPTDVDRASVDGAARSVAGAPPIGRRGDTTSGPGTAPGEIGRRFRPEPAALDTDKAILPAESASSADGTGPARSSRTRRPADGGAKDIDSFRRMLQQRGFIAPTDDGDNDASARPSADGTVRRTPQRPRPGSDAPATRPSPSTRRDRTDQPARPAEARPAEARPAEARPAEARPAEARPAEARPPRSRPPGGDSPADGSASAAGAAPESGGGPDGGSEATSRVTDGARPMVGELLQRRINRMLPDGGAGLADMPAPGSTAGPLDTADHTGQQPFGVSTIERSDSNVTPVIAPPPGGTIQSATAAATTAAATTAAATTAAATTAAATTATVQRSIESTRIGQTRAAPGTALAMLADRAGLPHTQSDQRRPVSTIARSLAPGEHARPADASRLRTVTRPDTPDTGSTRLRPAVAVAERAEHRVAQRVTDTKRRFEQPDIDAPVSPVAGRTDAPAATAIPVPTRSPDSPAVATTGAIVAPTATSTQIAVSTQLDARVLARPGRLGRIAGDEQFPTGLQRHSVVRPGPGALQRALADHSMPTQVRPAAPVGRTPDDPSVDLGRSNEPTRSVASPGDWIDTSGSIVAPALDDAPSRPPASRPAESTRDAAAPDRPAHGPGDQPIARQSVPPTVTERTGHVLRRSTDDPADVAPATRPEALDTITPPATSLGDRFLHELSRRPAPKPTPLPAQYRPIAQAITGHHKVMLSVDENSRRALRSVDKVAATTDNVIHLDKPLTPGRRATEVLAHELTHVANPSPAPRFFDDDVRSPEERQAEQVAKVMARAPLAPSGAVSRSRAAPATPASRTSSGSETIQRTAATPQGTLNAAALAASITGTAPAPTEQVIRRSAAPTTAGANRAAGETIQRVTDVNESQSTHVAAATSGSNDMSDADFRDLVDRNFEYVLRRLEQRMIVELERRGGRFWRGV